jgi:hypothetical protein
MSVVSISHFQEKSNKEVIDFIADSKFLLVKFHDEEGVEIMSNFMPGLLEATLLHMAYMYASNLLMYEE